jgi:hypothetical protein
MHLTWLAHLYKPNSASLTGSLKKAAAAWEFSLFDGDSSLCSLTVG